MGSFKRPRTFDSLDLKIIDLVYEAVWAQIVARDPFRDTEKDGERQEALRRRLFVLIGPGTVDFDNLYDKVLASMPETWITVGDRRSSPARGS
jgi:hypothetical protein